MTTFDYHSTSNLFLCDHFCTFFIAYSNIFVISGLTTNLLAFPVILFRQDIQKFAQKISRYKETFAQSTFIRILEYHSVCPLCPNWDLPHHPLSRKRVCPPPGTKGGGTHSPWGEGVGWGGSQIRTTGEKAFYSVYSVDVSSRAERLLQNLA